MAEKNSVDLDRDPRSIIGTRTFDAPRDLVFEAFSDPKHLAQWWGPIGFTTTTSAFDFKPGGVWRFVMHGPDGRDYQNRITFDEIVPPQRIAYHHGGGDVEPVQFNTTVTFEDLGNNRTRLVWHGTFSSAEERARVIRDYGADKGLVETLSRLAGYVESRLS
ncbi:MAG TPA: SRPBCC family protein [Pseudolabrys sp.]